MKAVGKLKSGAMVHENDIFLSASSLEGGTKEETVMRVDEAEEKERKRRISIPFTGTEETEQDVEEVASQLSSCHEELLHLFAVHEVSTASFLVVANLATRCHRALNVCFFPRNTSREEKPPGNEILL